MRRSNDPWQNVAMLAGIAATVGAGVGAASALTFAERRAAAQDRELDSLSRRLTTLERLSERVAKLETGTGAEVARGSSAS